METRLIVAHGCTHSVIFQTETQQALVILTGIIQYIYNYINAESFNESIHCRMDGVVLFFTL